MSDIPDRNAYVPRQALSQLEGTLASRAPSETLQPFVGQALTLAISDPTIDGKPTGNLKIYKSSYCAAVLKHYSDREREQKLENRIATYSLIKFAEKGIDTWIQDFTGWRQWQESIQPYTNVYIQRIEHMRDHQINDDLWVVFREGSELLLLIKARQLKTPLRGGVLGSIVLPYESAAVIFGIERVFVETDSPSEKVGRSR